MSVQPHVLLVSFQDVDADLSCADCVLPVLGLKSSQQPAEGSVLAPEALHTLFSRAAALADTPILSIPCWLHSLLIAVCTHSEQPSQPAATMSEPRCLLSVSLNGAQV